MEIILFLVFVMILFTIYQRFFVKQTNRRLDWRDIYLIKLRLQLMTPREFEYFVAGLYSLMGYRVNVTSATRDGGIDVEVYDREGNMIAIECKLYDKEKCSIVSRPIAQKLVGACEYAKKRIGKEVRCAIFSTSTFTNDCIEYCNKMNVEMYDTERILEIVRELDTNRVLALAGIMSSDVQLNKNVIGQLKME